MSDAYETAPAITVIGPARTRTFRVLWMLEELGLPYIHDPSPPRSAAVTRYSASGKVPVLLTEGVALTDSTAILTWLADSHDVLTAPAGTLGRARQDALTQRLLDEFDALLWMAARHSFVLPEAQRVPAIKDSLKWEFARNAAALATEFGPALAAGRFLTGKRITVPDIIATHCLSWAQAAKFELQVPALDTYFSAMTARPAYRRTLEKAGNAG